MSSDESDLLLLTIVGMHTKAVGEISTAIILSEFLKAGFPVLLPFGDNQRYDLVVEVNGCFLRVQCKTASRCGWKNDKSCLRFHARSTNRTSRVSTDYRDQADLFAAYAPSTEQVYIVPVEEGPTTDVWLRVEPSRNGQQRHIRMAEAHTLAAWAAKIGQASTSVGMVPKR